MEISKVVATPLIAVQEAAKHAALRTAMATKLGINWEQLPTLNWPSTALFCLYGAGRGKKSGLFAQLFPITPELISCVSNQYLHVNVPIWLFPLCSVQCRICPKWLLEPVEPLYYIFDSCANIECQQLMHINVDRLMYWPSITGTTHLVRQKLVDVISKPLSIFPTKTNHCAISHCSWRGG